MRLRSRARVSACLAAAVVLVVAPLVAEEEAERREMTQAEIETWLEADEGPEGGDLGPEDQAEAPPPPPPHHGLVLESSVGALGHIGPLKNVSPTSPWFHLQLGYEPLHWLMLFGEADLVFGTTKYANPPPEPRSYALYGGGGGLRLTIKPTERVGIYLQGSVGAAKINDDVLVVYGYPNADRFGLYYAGQLGLEWYQVSPHYALAVHGGLRNYQEVLGHDRLSDPALAWTGGAAIRYVF